MFIVFRKVFILINYLQKNNIPHNIYVTRALNKDINDSYYVDTRDCIRVFIWARTPSGKSCIQWCSLSLPNSKYVYSINLYL